MSRAYSKLLVLGLSVLGCLVLSGCISHQVNLAETPVRWGDTVNGLQIGIAAQTDASAPNQPQAHVLQVESVKVYVRNNGQTSLTIVDPTTAIWNGPGAILISIESSPIANQGVWLNRAMPPNVITLTPSQTVWVAATAPYDLANQQGELKLTAKYENKDSSIVVGSSTSATPPRTVDSVWTGSAKSGELILDANP